MGATRSEPSPVSPVRKILLSSLLAEDMHRKVACVYHGPSAVCATLVVGRKWQWRVCGEKLQASMNIRFDEEMKTVEGHTAFLTTRITDSIAPRFSVPSLTYQTVDELRKERRWHTSVPAR